MEALKTGSRRVVGTKQVLRSLKAGELARVYAATDADTFIYQQVVRAAETAGVPCVSIFPSSITMTRSARAASSM